MNSPHFASKSLLAATMLVFAACNLRLHADDAFWDRLAPLGQAYDSNTSKPKSERVKLTEKRLSTLLRSSDPEDRQAAAFANSEFSSLLNRRVVIANFRTLVSDPNREVRLMALFGCVTCTGYTYGFVGEFLLPHIKPLRHDQDREIRQLAQSICFTYRKQASTE